LSEERRKRVVAPDELAADLAALGLARGGIVMAHVGLGRIGWLAGGAESVVRALLDVTGGTVVAQAGWELDPFYVSGWPAERRAAYERSPVAFEAASSAAAVADAGAFSERLRTWPGARASDHPTSRIVAVGPHAAELVADHEIGDAYGPASPYARLVAAGAQVLCLGAPPSSMSILRHAESIADGDGRRRELLRVPVRRGDAVEWIEYREVDVDRGGFPYVEAGVVAAGEEPHVWLAAQAADAGIARHGRVGDAATHLFEAAALVRAAVAVLERTFPAARA
jgi:aminoglycoside 3-N-acetyltransferase